MKRLVLACAAALFLSYPAFSLSFDALPRYQDEGAKLYVSGTGKLQQQNYREAVIDLERAVKVRPDMPEAFHNLGFAFEQLGSVQKAAAAYERALRLRPNYDSALNNLGFLLANSEIELNKAVMLCQRAVELRPQSASYRDSFGWALYKLDRFAEAAQQFAAAIKIDPMFFKAHFNLGLIDYNQKKYSSAAKHFADCLKLNANFYKAYISLADCCERLNENARALNYYRQALMRTSENDPIKRHLEKKIKQLSAESKQNYFSSVTGKNRGSKLQDFMNRRNKSGELGGALKACSSYANVNTSFSPISAFAANNSYADITPSTSAYNANQASYAALPQGSCADSARSSPWYSPQSIKARNERDTNTVSSSYSARSVYASYSPRQISVDKERELERKYSLAKSYLDKGLISEAEHELSIIINTAPETSMVSRQSRNLLLKVKKQADAKTEKQALTHLDMGKDFFRSGQYEMAEAEFNKTLKLEPDNAEAHKDLSLLYYNLGRHEAAYEESKRAIALDKKLKEAYVVLASLYAYKGRTDDALRTLKMVRQVSASRDAVDELAEKMINSLQQEY